MSDNKIKTFPKEKKITPDELTDFILHECVNDHQSFKWLLQIKGGVVTAICTDCAEEFNIFELIKSVIGETDG